MMVNVTVPWLTVEPGAGLLAAATVALSVTVGSPNVADAFGCVVVVPRCPTVSVLESVLPLKLLLAL